MDDFYGAPGPRVLDQCEGTLHAQLGEDSGGLQPIKSRCVSPPVYLNRELKMSIGIEARGPEHDDASPNDD